MADNSDNLVAQLIDGLDPGALVTKFVVIAEAIDTNGRRALYTASNEGAMNWDSVGLLRTALSMEEAAILKQKLEE
ncbi:MAG: hypothetical protein JWO15_3667 [Sphingomonadales bacterium]|nr:hypothetical protein [Sphingomonadales bacterium]